jgi:hypothetical protein
MIHFVARWWVIATILFLALLAGAGGPSNIGVAPVQAPTKRHGGLERPTAWRVV